MKKLLLLLLIVLSALLLSLLSSQPVFAQELAKPSTFHRLLMFNNNHELLVVKVKNSNRWVTPGWYQDNSLTIKEGLDELAASYGLTITPPILRGVFSLKTSQNNELSTRLVYTTTIKSGELKTPDMIEEIRWLSTDQAMKLITFAHINTQIEQLMKFPGTIWGGSQLMYLEDGVYKAKFIEPFYPLTDATR